MVGKGRKGKGGRKGKERKGEGGRKNVGSRREERQGKEVVEGAEVWQEETERCVCEGAQGYNTGLAGRQSGTLCRRVRRREEVVRECRAKDERKKRRK